MGKKLAITVMVALVASMLVDLPSKGAGGLVLAFPSASSDFVFNTWTSVATNTGVTPAVSGTATGTIRASVSSGTNGLLRLAATTGITASSSYSLGSFQAGSAGLATISFEGSLAAVSAALGSLEFRRTTNAGGNLITASVTDGTGLTFGSNYYEVYGAADVVGGSSSVSWDKAFQFAASKKILSTTAGVFCQGYLATITSQEEQTFAINRVRVAAWLGGSDEFSYVNAATGLTYANQSAAEGKFYWVTGPERGTQITTANGTLGRITDIYQNWWGAEPNGKAGEHAVHMRLDGLWLDSKFDSTAPTVSKFIVEYGGVLATSDHQTVYTDVSHTNPLHVGTVGACAPAVAEGTKTASFSTRSIAPGAPTDLVASVAAGVTSASLTWNAPAAPNGGTAITGYKVELSSNGTTWSSAIADTESATLSYTITDLNIGVSYSFRVSAINSAGTSTPTASAPVTITLGPPGAPTSILATLTAGVAQAPLAWTAPTSNGGSAITGYKVEYSSDGSTWVTASGNTATATLSFTVTTGLAIGVPYTFRVAAINAIGTSSATSSSTLTIAPVAPGAPTSVAASVTTGLTSAVVTWLAPSSNGGGVITGYKVEFSSDGTTWTSAIADTETAALSYAVIGLSVGSSYTFRAYAKNAAGTSVVSSASSPAVTIVATAPDAPTGVAAAVSAGITSASLTWTGPASTGGSAITGYKIEKNDSSSWTTVVADTASTLNSHTVTGLAIGGTYTFRVSAINVAGLSTTAASSQVTISPAPAPPPYSGPLPTGVSAATASAGDKIIISGRGLGTITSVTIDGVTIEVSNQSATSFEITIPEGLLPGRKDIRILSSQGNLTYQSAIEILAEKPKTTDQELGAIEAPALRQKVNAGSFKGYVVLYALNHEGKRLSAKVGNDWVIVASIPKSVNNLYRHVEFTGVGYEVQVRIFIDRKLEATIPLLTK